MIFRPDSLADLGAHGGIHSRGAWQPIRMQDSYSGRQGPSILAVRQRPSLFGNAVRCRLFARVKRRSATDARSRRAVWAAGTETASRCSATVKYTGSQCNCDDSSERHRFSPNYPLAGISIGHWVVWTRARAIRMLRHDRDRAKDCA